MSKAYEYKKDGADIIMEGISDLAKKLVELDDPKISQILSSLHTAVTEVLPNIFEMEFDVTPDTKWSSISKRLDELIDKVEHRQTA